MSGPALSSGWRKRPFAERAAELAQVWPNAAALVEGPPADLAEVMVENAVGTWALPLGLVTDFPVNGGAYTLPLATEEPSVIAAANHAGRLIGRGGGLSAEADPSLMSAEVFLEGTDLGAADRILAAEAELAALVAPTLASMSRRHGGWRGLQVRLLPETGVLAVVFTLDVVDALGANLLNSVAEEMSPRLESLSGGRKVMAILTNNCHQRRARAGFRLPFSGLAKPGLEGAEAARRVVLASRIAEEDPDRAVTHNKGIMNGITALALATGNDTRALEAAVHTYAARDGRARPLSRYRLDEGHLVGEIELPLGLATVGGAVGFHPQAQAALALLGRPGARQLSALAAALGLAQNLAALLALTGEGIQRGHMALHQKRIDWLARQTK